MHRDAAGMLHAFRLHQPADADRDARRHTLGHQVAWAIEIANVFAQRGDDKSRAARARDDNGKDKSKTAAFPGVHTGLSSAKSFPFGNVNAEGRDMPDNRQRLTWPLRHKIVRLAC